MSKKQKTEPKVALITGITGQDGSYLAELLVELLTLRLEESKKQADIKSSFKKYQD